MGRSKLVCNLGMDDFFTFGSDVWRRKGPNPISFTDDETGKRLKGYVCVSLYDNTQEIILNGIVRVELVDK